MPRNGLLNLSTDTHRCGFVDPIPRVRLKFRLEEEKGCRCPRRFHPGRGLRGRNRMPPASNNPNEFPKTFDDRLEELRRCRALLLLEIETAKTTSAGGSSGSNAWSAAGVVYHVHLSEMSIARMLKKALDSSARGAIADSEQLRAEWERIRTLIGARR